MTSAGSKSYPLRMLIVFSSDGLGGAEKSLIRMAEASDSEIEFHMASVGGAGSLAKYVFERGFRFENFFVDAKSAPLSSLLSTIYMMNVARRQKYDLIYAVGLKIAIFARVFFWLAPRAKIIVAVRWVPTSQTPLDRLFRLSERILSLITAGWIANSSPAYLALVKCLHLDPKRVGLIFNGVSKKPPKPIHGERTKSRILTVANFMPLKGHEPYLEMISGMGTVVDNLTFDLVGGGVSRPKIEQKVKELGLERQVSVPGFVNDPTSFYMEADLFVLPSMSEGAPTSILEAMSFGLPVVAFDVGGVSDLVESEVSGYLVTAGDFDKLAQQIVKLAMNKRLSAKMGEQGRRIAETKFTLKKCAQDHETFFRTR